MQEDDRAAALQLADKNIRSVLSEEKFERSFADIPETYKDKATGTLKRTGNRLMDRTCSYCGFKMHCWPNAAYKQKTTSTANTRPRVWYTKHVKDEI